MINIVDVRGSAGGGFRVLRRLLGWVALGALACLLGCSGARATDPERLQGIVEHDERILAFEVGGRVKTLDAVRGDSVQAGAPLGSLDDGMERPLRAARAAELAAARAQLDLVIAGPRREEIRAARAELSALETQRALLQQGLERQLTLAASGVSAPTRREEIDAQLASVDGRRGAITQQLLALRRGARSEELDAAEARVDAASAALAAMDARLTRYALTAPAAGTVIDTHVEVGEVVAPGTPAFTMADLDHPFVDVFVPEGRMRSVRLGQRARVRVDGVPDELVGRVEHVGTRTEFTPRFLFSERERPNLVLRVRIRVEDPRHALHAGVPAFVHLEGSR